MSATTTTDKFTDSHIEYLNYAAKTKEKECNAKLVETETASLAQTFVRAAGPNETFKIFEFGMGNAQALKGAIKAVHTTSPETPITVTAKEFDPEYVVKGLQNLAFAFEHSPNFSIAITNAKGSDALSLREEGGKKQIVHRVKLKGTKAEEHRTQFSELGPKINAAWETQKQQNGRYVPKHQGIIIVSHKDRDQSIEKAPNVNTLNPYHLATIIHAWRLAAKPSLKAGIISSVANSLSPIGKAFAIQARGNNSGEKIIQDLWPEKRPFEGFGSIINTVKNKLKGQSDQFAFTPKAPITFATKDPVSPFEALRLAVYAAQIPLETAKIAAEDPAQLQKVKDILSKDSGHLSFSNEVLEISPT